MERATTVVEEVFNWEEAGELKGSKLLLKKLSVTVLSSTVPKII